MKLFPWGAPWKSDLDPATYGKNTADFFNTLQRGTYAIVGVLTAIAVTMGVATLLPQLWTESPPPAMISAVAAWATDLLNALPVRSTPTP